jgi:hypothetical protein
VNYVMNVCFERKRGKPFIQKRFVIEYSLVVACVVESSATGWGRREIFWQQQDILGYLANEVLPPFLFTVTG